MPKKSFNQIKWATPENPHGLWAYCIICNKDIRELRTRKNTCSEECHKKKIHDIDKKSYVNKMANDPLYAQKQSAKQYARIKADPEKMEDRRIAQRERMQMSNYKESVKKSQDKYRANPEYKEMATKRMRRYKDENPEIIAEIEARRIEKRSTERERLKLEEPEKYLELTAKERASANMRKAEKRLSELKLDLDDLANE
jgi:predicted nucleic acid-binding Zn ribbon protein